MNDAAGRAISENFTRVGTSVAAVSVDVTTSAPADVALAACRAALVAEIRRRDADREAFRRALDRIAALIAAERDALR